MRSLFFSLVAALSLVAVAACEVGDPRPIEPDAGPAIVLPADHAPIPGSPTLFVTKDPRGTGTGTANCSACHTGPDE